MKRYRWIFWLWGLGFITPTLYGQDKTAESIPFMVDFASFRAQDGYACLEIYFSVLRRDLAYRRTEESFEANFELRAEFFRGDSLVKADAWRLVDALPSLEPSLDQYLYHQVSVFLEAGDYRVETRILDRVSERDGGRRERVFVPSFSSTDLTMSDIQIGLRLFPDRSRSRFSKNGYYILPNPHALYNAEWPNVYYYCEIYNLSPLNTGLDSSYVVTRNLIDPQGKSVRETSRKVRQRIGIALVEADSVVVSDLIPGQYILGIEVRDRATGQYVSRERPFMVYNPVQHPVSPADDAQGRKDEIYSMTMEELDRYFEPLQYITEKDERRNYRRIRDIEGKREFIESFWMRRDPDASTLHNEAKSEYMRRLEYVNSTFASRMKEGWKSDRGRIYLIYGEPYLIDRYPSSLGQRPFQVWTYPQIDQGVEFVFVDVSGFGEMILVHSTAKEEIRDYDWKEKWLFE
jgi:GWxTD domain-containing protein